MALIKRDYVCSQPRPLPVPNTKRHSVSVRWVSGLPPTEQSHDAIMTVVDWFWKRGMFIPCGRDMTANDLVYVFVREVI